MSPYHYNHPNCIVFCRTCFISLPSRFHVSWCNDTKRMFEIWNTNFNCFLLQGNHQIYLSLWILASFPAGHYMFKVNNRNTTTRCKICSNLTMQTPEWRQWCRSCVYICCLWTYFAPCSSVSIVNFQHVNAS